MTRWPLFATAELIERLIENWDGSGLHPRPLRFRWNGDNRTRTTAACIGKHLSPYYRNSIRKPYFKVILMSRDV